MKITVIKCEPDKINVDIDRTKQDQVVIEREGKTHSLPNKINPINTNILPGDVLLVNEKS